MKKKFKIQKEPAGIDKKGKKAVKDIVPAKTGGSIVKNSYTIAVLVSLLVLFLSILATIKAGPISGIQTSIFTALRLPLDTLHLNNIKLIFPPFFMLDVFFACAAAFVLMALYLKKTGAIKDLAAVFKNAGFAALIAIIHVFLTTLFVSHSMFLMQLLLFAAEMYMLGRFAAARDSANRVGLKAGVLRKSELIALLVFAAFVLMLNMFDWKSWKYSFIGDEWSFYDYAKGILKGKKPLDFFSGEGVYGFNPVLSSAWQAFIMSFTGQGVFGWKLSSALIVPLTIIPFYMWNKMVFNRTAAMIATAAFALSVTMLAFSHIGYNNIQVVFFYAASLLAFELALRKNSAFWAFMTALVLGLGCYTYYLSRLMIIMVFFYWLFHPRRKGFSGFNLFFLLAVYALCVSLLPLEQGFLHNMANRSAVGTSEITNAADRPWFIAINFIESLFFFITKSRESHYITGGLTDFFTAAGALAGFVWILFSVKKDWRARLLLASYIVLVFFTGGLVQYYYPANTRMQFLLPMLATIAGIGLSRLSAAAAYFKNAFKINRLSAGACVLAIACLNFHNFYFYMPKHFQFAIQAHVIKYLQQNTDKECVMALSDILNINEITAFYGLDKKSKKVSMEGLYEMSKTGQLKGKSVMLDMWTAESQEKLAAFCKPGYIIRDYVSRLGILYIYDFTGDFIYCRSFAGLLETGSTDYIVGDKIEKGDPAADFPERKEIADTEPAGPGAGGSSMEIKSFFAFEGSYRSMRSNEIKNFSLSVIKLDTALLAPSDVAVSGGNDILYIADSGAWKILIFLKEKENTYRLSKRFDPEKSGVFGMLKPAISDGSTGPLCLALDNSRSLLYVLDAYNGKISVFDAGGTFIKEIARGELLKNAASLAVSPSGDRLVAANPGKNMFMTMGADGRGQNGYTTTNGAGMGQLDRPCYAGFDSENNYYIADTLNGRVEKFNRSQKYITNYRIGLLAREQYPRVRVFDAGVKKPYMAVTQPETKKVYFYLLNEDAFRTVSLENDGELKFENPSAISADDSGNMYILDTESKAIVKLTIPGNAMSDYIKMAPRR